MGKARFISIIVATIAVIGLVALVINAVASEPKTFGPISPVREGTVVPVQAEASYSEGQSVSVSGVEITVVDEKGNSQNLTTIEGSTSFEMLSGHPYSIRATFKGSTGSTEATIQGYSGHNFPPSGGQIVVWVERSSDIIESVTYHEPTLL